MGTDIHINVDRLSENGHWIRTDLQVDEDRNYDLFAILADVRNGEGCAGVRTGDGFVPISEPRGWGEVDVKEDDPYHSASWLLLSEILDYDYRRPSKSGYLTKTNTRRGYVVSRLGIVPELAAPT